MRPVYLWALEGGPRTPLQIALELRGTAYEREPDEIRAVLDTMPEVVCCGRDRWRLRVPALRSRQIPAVAIVALVQAGPLPFELIAGVLPGTRKMRRQRIIRAAERGLIHITGDCVERVVEPTHLGERALRVWRRSHA